MGLGNCYWSGAGNDDEFVHLTGPSQSNQGPLARPDYRAISVFESIKKSFIFPSQPGRSNIGEILEMAVFGFYSDCKEASS